MVIIVAFIMQLKEKIKFYLEEKGLEVYDKGGNPTPEEDCPDGQQNPKVLEVYLKT